MPNQVTPSAGDRSRVGAVRVHGRHTSLTLSPTLSPTLSLNRTLTLTLTLTLP